MKPLVDLHATILKMTLLTFTANIIGNVGVRTFLARRSNDETRTYNYGANKENDK